MTNWKQIAIGAAIGLLIAGTVFVSAEFSLYDWGYRHRQELRWLILFPVVILARGLWQKSDGKHDNERQP